MPTPALPEVEEVAAALAGDVPTAAPGIDALWQITGPATAGKSSCLVQVEKRLAEQSELKPILVSPPKHHLDAGPSALNDVVVGLARHGLLNGGFATWRDERVPWVERVRTVRRWVTDAQNEVVLLFDEPRSWGAHLDDFFAQKTFDTAFFLSGLPCRKVVAGKLAVPLSPISTWKLRPGVPDRAWLDTPEDWGELSAAARAVASSALVEQSGTALHVRLLIATVALSSLDEARHGLGQPPDLRRTVRTVTALVADDPRRERLWQAWQALSLSRRPIDASLLEALLPSDLTTLERDVVQHCLLYGDDELQLHDVLKLQASRWRAEHDHVDGVRRVLDRTNRKLFEVHRDRFTRLSTAEQPEAITEAGEAFHFASATGEADLIEQATPMFVEQLDALGWSLSYERHDFVGAARAFRSALDWDGADDYAHHYLAYNLERSGETSGEVEHHYREAVGLNPGHSWWRARLIIFLVSQGRICDARNEWDDALLELGVGEGDASPAMFDHLHCWVAGALLDVGEVRFAREVLEGVPVSARDQIDAYAGLEQRVAALLELGDGPAVVPSWRLRPSWWTNGPELLQHRFATGESLVRWLAGRVERKDDEGIHIRAAVLNGPEQDNAPRIAWTVMSARVFDELCRDDVSARDLEVGTFVEIGLYALPEGATQPKTLVRVIPERHRERRPSSGSRHTPA
jgi:hypothetical protein